MDSRKLEIAGTRRKILIQALTETSSAMDRDMRGIYDTTAKQAAEAPFDKILLTRTQTGIVMHALEEHEKRHGESDETKTMLLQLALTRKAFREATQAG